MSHVTEEEKEAESKRARERNMNTIRIEVIQNGILVKKGNEPTIHFANLNDAFSSIFDFVNECKRSLDHSDNDRLRGQISKEFRHSSRSELVRQKRRGALMSKEV